MLCHLTIWHQIFCCEGWGYTLGFWPSWAIFWCDREKMNPVSKTLDFISTKEKKVKEGKKCLGEGVGCNFR